MPQKGATEKLIHIRKCVKLGTISCSPLSQFVIMIALRTKDKSLIFIVNLVDLYELRFCTAGNPKQFYYGRWYDKFNGKCVLHIKGETYTIPKKKLFKLDFKFSTTHSNGTTSKE